MSSKQASAISVVLRIVLGLIALATPAFSKGKPLRPSGAISIICRAGETVYPSGKIFVDGEEWGACPGARVEVFPGVHSVRVGEALGNDRYMAYQNERVEVRKNSTKNIIANLALVSAEKAAGLAYALGPKHIGIPFLDKPDASNIQVLSPDGMILAAGAETNSVRLYDATNGKSLQRLGELGKYWVSNVTNISFSADGGLLASTGWLRDEYKGEINIWNMRTRRLVRTIPNLKEVFALAFSPDGKLLAAGVGVNEVRVWSVMSGRLLWSANPPGRADEKISQLFFSADGKLLVTGPYYGEAISVYDMRTAKHLSTLQGNLVMPGKAGLAFTFSYRGLDHTLQRTWRLQTGELIDAKLRNTSAVRAMNEQVVIAASRNVSGLDPRNERLMQALGEQVQIVLTPDGSRWQIYDYPWTILSLPAFPGSGEASAPQEIPTIDFCEMVKNPKAYFDKRVRIIARYQMATEAAYFEHDRCPLSHDHSIGVGHVALEEKQRGVVNTELRKISAHEYGGRAMVTVVGILRNVSRHDFAWYQYRFDIVNVENISPVIIPYEGELQGGITYLATIRGDRVSGLSLVPAPRINENYAMRIEWINLSEFPQLEKLRYGAGEERIVFTVLSDEIKQMTERRWNRTLKCKIIRVE